MTRYQTALTGVCWLIIMMFAPCLMAQSPPTLVFPKNNIVTSTTSIPFEWNTVQSATNYHIQVAENNSFSPLSYENTNVSGTSFTFNLTGGKKYYWRVRANTPGGYTGWSSIWALTIFSPSNATSLVTWYKADYGVHVDVNGKVSQWDDASGNGNNAVQTDPSLSPLLVNSACEINNNPLLRFDGTDDYVNFTTTLTSIETVFWLVKEDPNATRKYRSLLGDNNNQPDFHRGCCTGGFPGIDKTIYDDQYASPKVQNGVTRVNGTIVPALSTNMPTTMSIIDTRTTGDTRANTFSVDRPDDLGEYRTWWGDLSELIIYNNPLPDSLINLVEEYLRYKYAPPVNLGADITLPYKLCDNITVSVANCYKIYSWSTGATTNSIQVTSPGTYMITVTDQFNRISKDTITVNFVRPFVIQPALICYGDSIVWNTGLSNAYTFQWQDGSSNSSFVIHDEGDYWVKVTDSTGCMYPTPTVHIDVDSFAAIADLGNDTSICQGQSIGLVSGANLAVDYLWNTGSTAPTITVSSTGVYRLTATDAGGCQKIDSILVDIGAHAPTTNFSATDTCFGFSTQFTNQSIIDTPNHIVQLQWDFGDGSFDTVPNPIHTYASPGAYPVRLTATADNLCLNIKTKTVNVYSLPQALFMDSVACVNSFITFEDASIPAPGAAISSWRWDFNDNSIASQQNPDHQFDSVRTYHVKLDITDSRGCKDSYTGDVESVPPVALADQPNLILPKDNMTLSDSSVFFDWQASNGAFSYTLQISITPVFSNVISSINTGTADSAIVSGLSFGTTYYWRVQAFNLCGDFTNSDVYRFNYFRPTSLPGLCLWLSADYGDSLDINGAVAKWNDQSSSSNDATQASSLHRPTLIPHVPELNDMPALWFEGQNNEDQYVQFSRLNNIRTVFWVVMEDTNATPFYRSLLGITNDQSDFHRGCCTGGFPGVDKTIYDDQFASSSVITGVTHMNGNVIDPLETDMPTKYSIISTKTTGDTRSDCFSCDLRYSTDHRYWWGGLAELIVYCQPLDDAQISTVENYLNDKYAPPVNLGPDITLSYGVCAPTTLNAGNRFVRYRWSTGDTTSSIQVNGQGTYTVIVTDIFGRTTYDAVNITGGLNTVTFDDTLFLCLGDSLIWNTGLNHDYDFLWQDGSTDSFFVIKNPGDYWVQVIDSFGCSVTSDTVFVQIDSFSVQATLGPDTNLCSGNRISLVVGGENAVSYAWSDGSTEPEFTVDTSGDYSVTVENSNQCFASDIIHVNIIGVAPHANFSFSTACLNDTVHFTDLTMPPPPSITSWHWDFGDNKTSTAQHPNHFYNSSSTYSVKLTVADTLGCSQNVTKPVTVYPLPVAAFTHDLVNCANDLVHFHDASTIATGQNITIRNWSFGDGTSSSEINPIHTYQTSGVYPVSLQVTTDKLCTSTAYDTIEIFPELKAEIGAGNLCFDYPVDFHDNSPNFSIVSWNWDFGDHTFSTQRNPVHIYDYPASFTVSLKVKNAIGCQRTVTDTFTVTAHPTVDFESPSICEDVSHQFFDNTTTNGGDNVVAWQWTFGDNSNVSHVQNPTHAYDSAANYNVTLNVRTKNGCENFVTKPITVIQPPVANFTFTPNYGAAPLTVNFTNHSQGATDYLWDFGDNSAPSTEIHPTHTYLQNDTVVIRLIASNVAGCSDTASSSLNISVATLDIALDNVILEKAFNDDCSYFLKMGAYVLNIGTRDVTSFDILASNSNGGTIVEHWEGNFISRQTTYPFNADFLISDCSDDVVICMEVMNPNGQTDENPLNNRKCVTLSSNLVVIGPSPNPTGDFVNLDILTPSKGDLRIHNYNVIGQDLGEMKKGQVDKGYHQYNFDISHLAAGVYLLKIEFNDESRVIKYVVK